MKPLLPALLALTASLRGAPHATRGAQLQHVAPPAAVRVASRLARMPLEELRALVADAGLEVCDAQNLPDESDIPRRQRCATTPRAGLTDALLRQLQAQWAFGASPPHLGADSLRCRHVPEGERCAANRGGPEGVHWYFTGPDTALRLARVVRWSLSS